MHSRFPNHPLQSPNLSRKKTAAERSKAIIPSPRIVVLSGFALYLLYHALIHQFLKIVVEGSGTKFVFTFRLARDFLHDAVAMSILGCQSKEDVQRGGRERKITTEVLSHVRFPLYRIPTRESRFCGRR